MRLENSDCRDYCQIFQLDCSLTGCGISDDCQPGQFCQNTEEGEFECGHHQVSQIFLDNGQKYFGQINKGSISYQPQLIDTNIPCWLLTGEIPNGHGVSYYHEDPDAIQYEGNLSPRTSHQTGPLSLVEVLHYCALIGRELQGVAVASKLMP